jgi:hypothetical protein
MIAWSASAQQPQVPAGDPEPQTHAGGSEHLPPCAIPIDLDDEPFSRYVDLLLLGQAWDFHDSALLADLGLQLAHGEQVLFRSHKAIESESILEISANIAADRKDHATLERLKKAAAASGSKRLAAVEETTRGPTDATHHSVGHSIEELSPHALAFHQFAIKKIRVA